MAVTGQCCPIRMDAKLRGFTNDRFPWQMGISMRWQWQARRLPHPVPCQWVSTQMAFASECLPGHLQLYCVLLVAQLGTEQEPSPVCKRACAHRYATATNVENDGSGAATTSPGAEASVRIL